MGEHLETLREKLSKGGDRASAEAQKRAIKSPKLTYYGTKKPAFNKVLADFVESNQSIISLTPLHPLLSNLWKSNVFEERLFGLHVLLAFRGLLGEREWVLLNEWEEDVDNFALADWIAHVRGWLLRRYPERVSTLLAWCHSENVWKRRSAVVSLLVIEPEEKGHGQIAVPARQALRVIEALLTDKDPMVQKAVVWIGRVIAQEAPEHFMRVLEENRFKAQKATLRSAADGLPERQRKEFLEALERPAPPPPPPPEPKKGMKGAKVVGTIAPKGAGAFPAASKGAAAGAPGKATPGFLAKGAKPGAGKPAPGAKAAAAKPALAGKPSTASIGGTSKRPGAKPPAARTVRPAARRPEARRPKPAARRSKPAARGSKPAARRPKPAARKARAAGGARSRAASSRGRGARKPSRKSGGKKRR
jgi:3-methyladenine DNA glycosylase AlkD